MSVTMKHAPGLTHKMQYVVRWGDDNAPKGSASHTFNSPREAYRFDALSTAEKEQWLKDNAK